MSYLQGLRAQITAVRDGGYDAFDPRVEVDVYRWTWTWWPATAWTATPARSAGQPSSSSTART
jgi:hypothetical protein